MLFTKKSGTFGFEFPVMFVRDKLFINSSHCVNIVRIQSYSGPYFSAFGVNTEKYRVSLRIQSKSGKIGNRITPNRHFSRSVKGCKEAPIPLIDTLNLK